jgi:hypothetical protein
MQISTRGLSDVRAQCSDNKNGKNVLVLAFPPVLSVLVFNLQPQSLTVLVP